MKLPAGPDDLKKSERILALERSHKSLTTCVASKNGANNTRQAGRSEAGDGSMAKMRLLATFAQCGWAVMVLKIANEQLLLMRKRVWMSRQSYPIGLDTPWDFKILQQTRCRHKNLVSHPMANLWIVKITSDSLANSPCWVGRFELQKQRNIACLSTNNGRG